MGSGFLFFDRSYCDITRYDLGEITLTIDNNDSEKTNLIDRNRFTKWSSVGANSDLTSVVLTVDFNTNRTLTDLILVNSNLKEFQLEYWNGSIWVNSVTEIANDKSTYRKEITPIVTDQIRFTMNKTIIANQEKEVELFIITGKIGQLEYRPTPNPGHTSDIIENKMITGKSRFVLNDIQYQFDIVFEHYTNVADRQLLLTLSNKFDAFLFWPCGGDETQFSFSDDGFRRQDIFLMAVTERPKPYFSKNYYKAGTNATLKLSEVS